MKNVTTVHAHEFMDFYENQIEEFTNIMPITMSLRQNTPITTVSFQANEMVNLQLNPPVDHWTGSVVVRLQRFNRSQWVNGAEDSFFLWRPFSFHRIFTSQLKSGKDYDELNKVISILIVDFKMIADCQNYYHKFMMLGDECGSRHMILNEIHVLELPKLPKNSDGSKRYDWLTFIDWEKEETIKMIVEKDENIKEAYVTLKRLSLDEQKQYIFEAREKAQRDERAREKFIRREAQEKSREEGLKEGREEGRKEGRKEGQEEMRIEVAKKLVTNGLSAEIITEATGLPESLIKQLQKEIKSEL